MADVLSSILARKRVENARRARHALPSQVAALSAPFDDRAAAAYQRLARNGDRLPRVIAEIKLASPSAGTIRPRRAGEVVRIARDYEAAGAAAISVLCDRAGFGGSVLDARRAASAVRAPVLFKEFVLDERQVALARACGASLVLLLVRALEPSRLAEMVACVESFGMGAVVEAADDAELDVALDTRARIVGVNARDLRTFRVDGDGAERIVARVPRDRIAVYMSGVRNAEQLQAIGSGRADAVLVGEGLMRTQEPGSTLRRWLQA